MRTRLSIRTCCLFGLLLGFAACGIIESDRVQKTYPEASELERVSLLGLKETAPVPASYNIEVYVVGRNICNACCKCIRPDGITIAENGTPDLPEEGLHVAVTAPRQFRLGHQYVLSVKVSDEGFTNELTGKPVRHVTLLGYSEVE